MWKNVYVALFIAIPACSIGADVLLRLYGTSVFPELTLFADARERWKALKAARKTRRLFRYRAVLIGVYILVAGAAWPFLRRHAGLPEPWLYAVLVGLAYATSTIADVLLGRRIVSRRLRDQLRARGVSICLECGYDLRAGGTRCPECGAEYVPASDIAENRIA